MGKRELYLQYQKAVAMVAEVISKESADTSAILQHERQEISATEKHYSAENEQLENARRTMTEQYKSVLESCSSIAGIRRPSAQRPEGILIDWKAAVRKQEEAAKQVQEYLNSIIQKAQAERLRKLQEEQQRVEAERIAAAERLRMAEEERARQEIENGKTLLDMLRKKHKKGR